MHLLVTGGAGFIGSNFIRYILNKHRNYRIINLDKLTYAGNLKNLEDISKCRRYRFYQGDITDSKKVGRLIKNCDCLLNFAAETHVDRSIKSGDEFIRTNVMGAHVLLKLAKKYKIRRFIQISTDEVYGSIKRGKFDGGDKLSPSSPYSASKAAADELAHAHYVTYNLPIVIARSTNNFGPYQYPEKVIPLFITNIIEGKTIPVYGKGENIRDWIFVEDNCRAIDLILHKANVGEIYNISTDNPIDNLSLAKLIMDEMGASAKFIRFVKDRPGHDYRYAINSGKLQRLGFKSKSSFRKDLMRTINWYRTNRRWWQPLKKS